jgi:hypothetical protein
MSPPDDPDETLRQCTACGGHWRILAQDKKPVICKWCFEGMMSAKQQAAWQAHKSGPRRIS